MNRRGFVPPANSNPTSPESEVESLIAAARREAPEADLEQRVHDAMAYRRVLAEARPPWVRNASLHSNRLAFAVATLAVAAGALIWSRTALRHSTPSVAPESSAAHSITVPAVASAAPRDPCLKRVVAAGREPLIDDFEDGDDSILGIEGRAGLWRWARDTDAPNSAPALLPIPRDARRAGNQMALHVKGGRLHDWGAIVEFNFTPACYDASAYRGLSFQAKGAGRVYVAPREVGTIPSVEGGTCTSDCYNPHVKKVELDGHWKTYRVEWTEVEQRGYGRPPFDPKQLHSIAFLVRPEDTPYDVWVDDLSFLKR
jgi:hypothetical protein